MTRSRKKRCCVTFDSSAFRTEQPADLRIIAALSKAGVAQLALHDIVIRECASGLSEDALPKSSTRAAMRTVGEWLRTVDDESMAAAHSALRIKGTELGVSVEAAIRAWVKAAEGITIGVAETPANTVWDGYFSGSLPYGSPRGRDDIPDAMIFASVRTLADTYEVIFVADDKRLRRAAASAGNVLAFASLANLKASPIFGDLLSAFAATDAWVDEARSYLTDNEGQLAHEMGSRLLDELVGYDVEGDFPSDNRDATIALGDDELQNVTIDVSMAKRAGDHILQIPFDCETSVVVDVFIHKSDYWSIEHISEEYSLTDADWNDHYVLAQRETSVSVKGVMEVVIAGEVASSMSIDDVGAISLESVRVKDEVTE